MIYSVYSLGKYVPMGSYFQDYLRALIVWEDLIIFYGSTI